MLDSHKVRKLTKSDFWKKISAGQEGPKSPKKNGPKTRLWEFGQKSSAFISSFFILIWKYKWFLHFLEKPLIWEKSGSRVMI